MVETTDVVVFVEGETEWGCGYTLVGDTKCGHGYTSYKGQWM